DQGVTDYAWDYGDSSAVEHTTTPTTGHTYASAGTYTVTLTVTDGGGLDDDFNRSATNGLGTAATGGPWTVSQGGTRQNVTPGGANLTLPAANNNTGSDVG